MVEPTTIIIIIGLVTLLIERAFDWVRRIRYSECCGGKVEMKDDCIEKSRES